MYMPSCWLSVLAFPQTPCIMQVRCITHPRATWPVRLFVSDLITLIIFDVGWYIVLKLPPVHKLEKLCCWNMRYVQGNINLLLLRRRQILIIRVVRLNSGFRRLVCSCQNKKCINFSESVKQVRNYPRCEERVGLPDYCKRERGTLWKGVVL